MTIQQPPNDEIPATPSDEDERQPTDGSAEPTQHAPGIEQSPVGAPRDEPDSELA